MSNFLPGLELSRLFYLEAVKPVIDAKFPGLAYGAALIGSGSEILGFDTEMSADHYWGPRLMMFLADDDFTRSADALHETLARSLPYNFRGYSTNFTLYDDADNSLVLTEIESGSINHRVQVFTLRDFLMSYLNFDISQTIEPADWLTFPEQKLRTLTAGAVYHDEIGLRDALQKFDYYPHDVWLYLLAAGWNRIGQEEHLMGRAGIIGDETGSAIIGARLVRDLMRLCFLMEKQYAPYAKWFGKAFSLLECAARLTPVFENALAATGWQARENFLVEAYEAIAEMHNALGITESLPAKAANFFNRPFAVIHLHGNFAGRIAERISDEKVKRLVERRLIGGIDQISDNTDILSDPQWRTILRNLYE